MSEPLFVAAQRQSAITAAALIAKAREDFDAIVADIAAPDAIKARFSLAGAQQALLEAYVTLSGQALAGATDLELEAVIAERCQLLASGLRTFARQAPPPASA